MNKHTAPQFGTVYLFNTMKKREPKEYVIQPKGWKKKYKCHKNKGEYTFIVTHASLSCLWLIGGVPNIFEQHTCSACGKQKVYIVAW